MPDSTPQFAPVEYVKKRGRLYRISDAGEVLVPTHKRVPQKYASLIQLFMDDMER
jgi:hypothetical protein